MCIAMKTKQSKESIYKICIEMKQKIIEKQICCCPGSNWGPSVCKTDVITTTPQQLRWR